MNMTMAAATAAASKLKKGPEAGPSAPEVPTEVVVQSTSIPSEPSKPKQSSGGMKLQRNESKEINWDAIVPETQKETSEEEGNGWGKGVKLTFNRLSFIFNLIFSHGINFRTISFLHIIMNHESNSHYELITTSD
jgi:hypothetical protein